MGIMELIGEGHEGSWSIYLCIEFAQLPTNVYLYLLPSRTAHDGSGYQHRMDLLR
jgi:hypothetical protein